MIPRNITANGVGCSGPLCDDVATACISLAGLWGRISGGAFLRRGSMTTRWPTTATRSRHSWWEESCERGGTNKGDEFRANLRASGLSTYGVLPAVGGMSISWVEHSADGYPEHMITGTPEPRTSSGTWSISHNVSAATASWTAVGRGSGSPRQHVDGFQRFRESDVRVEPPICSCSF